MILQDVGILLVPGRRGQAYLQTMLKSGLVPGEVLLMDGKRTIGEGEPALGLFDPSESVEETLDRHGVPHKRVHARDCNEAEAIAAVGATSVSHLIYSGGGILRHEVLSAGPRFIHVHPGLLPRYRGSTCFYYSLIEEGRCGATAFFMEEGIDTGDILMQRIYEPVAGVDLDAMFDPWMRADLLVRLLRDYVERGGFHPRPQHDTGASTYYVIHPVLKTLALRVRDRIPAQEGER